MSEKIDAIDLILNTLQEHEKSLDSLVDRLGYGLANFDELVEEKARHRVKQILLRALDGDSP